MLIQRGIHTRALRINLMIQSEDVDTHGCMTDNDAVFNDIADHLAQIGINMVRESFPKDVEPKP